MNPIPNPCARRATPRSRTRPPSRKPASRLQVERLEDRLVPAGPSVLDPNLAVRTVVSGLSAPTSMAFLGDNDFFVLEKQTGKVQHVVNGSVVGTAIDLAVNNNSERGMLGIALHPNFATNHFVYLYWTQSAPVPTGDPHFPSQITGPDIPALGADTGNVLATPLLGNRVDRFIWNGSSLTFDKNLIRLHSFQFDATNGVARGNHNGGVIRFGPDGKLYILIGDNGRRGQMQNLRDGPFGPGIPDDQFGGPQPDNAHFTGVIIRLNDDGTAPTDNPFFAAGAAMGGEAGANVQKIYAYGVRNSFGLAFDPRSGKLWDEQNSDDAFDELNLVEPGINMGWVQIMGPVERIAQFKQIETTMFGANLQQVRWPPTNIADTPEEALSRLFMLPGARYSDPEFSWKFAVAPAGIGFMNGRALGPQYDGDLFVGAARTTLEGGYLFHFNLTGNRRKIGVDDPRLDDRVADNLAKFDITESESLLFGRDFGIGTDIHTGPNGNLFVVSNTNGAVYEIYRVSPGRAGASGGGLTAVPSQASQPLGSLSLAGPASQAPAQVSPASGLPPEAVDAVFAAGAAEPPGLALFTANSNASAQAHDVLGDIFQPDDADL